MGAALKLVAPVRSVWICAGLREQWRVTDGVTDYGEWPELADAITFKALLLRGNTTTLERLDVD